MSTLEPNFINILEQSIKTAIEEETKQLMDKAIKEVKETMDKRTPEIIAGIAVQIMGYVEMKSMSNQIIFQIKKQ